MDAQMRFREASIEAVVIRADGTREDLGVVSYWHKNPLKRWAFATKKLLRKVRIWQRS